MSESRPRPWISVAVAVVLFLLIASIPWHGDIAIRKAVALVVGALVLWISEAAPLGIVGLCVPVVATLSGLLTWPEAISTWGKESVFLFLGAFLLARALDKHGAFDWVARLQGASLSTTARLSLLVLVSAGVISTVQNNTAVTAMMLPAVVALARRHADPASPLLALSLGATFGGLATPVGTAPNFIGYGAIQTIDESFNFLTWLRVGLPIWLGATLIGWGILGLVARGESRRRDDTPAGLAAQASDDESFDRGHSPSAKPLPTGSLRDTASRDWALLVFAGTAMCWLMIGGIMSLTTQSHPVHAWIKLNQVESLVPIAAACLLFFIRPGGGPPVLERRDLAQIDWDTMFLIAGGMALGKVLESSGTGQALASAVAGAPVSPLAAMLLLGGVTVVMSELTSNTVTAALLVPLAGQIAPSLGLNPVQAILLVSLCASLGFALPISTPPNAIVYGTRMVPLRRMIRVGLLVDAVCVIWVVLCVFWLA